MAISRHLTVIFSCFLFVVAETVVSQSLCKQDTLENNILKLTGYLSDTRYNYPKTDADFIRYCSDHKEGSKFIKNYANKCLKGASKSTITVFVYSNTQATKKYCSKKNAKTRDEIVNFANCVNTNKNIAIRCHQSYLNKLNLTFSLENAKDKIPYMCCLSIEMKECILENLAKTRQCSEQVLENLGKYIDTISGNIFNVVCENIDENPDRCTKLIGTPKSKIKKVNLKTPFPIIFKIFETL